MRRYDLENYEDSWPKMYVAPDGDWVDYDDAVEAIAEAQRQGWEHAKNEVSGLVLRLCGSGRNIYNAIAAMEYKKEMK